MCPWNWHVLPMVDVEIFLKHETTGCHRIRWLKNSLSDIWTKKIFIVGHFSEWKTWNTWIEWTIQIGILWEIALSRRGSLCTFFIPLLSLLVLYFLFISPSLLQLFLAYLLTSQILRKNKGGKEKGGKL